MYIVIYTSPAPIRGPKSKGGGDFVNNYEVMYIVKPVEEEAFEALVAKFDNLINNNGGTVEKTDRWGKKRLAYEIDDIAEGLYVLVTFSAEPKTVKELDRVMKITDEILRHMIIRKGE
nr:30S ribosomal protein S6 [Phascolarctobacterium faecium]